ncbi:1,2-dihydroxy-3-keto-5-methylthiopentene dioxygenase [Coemansia sp. RSA 552]|nr:1,2-dihydroxy-3-keto-5-methylthiopentene dioxygenase [Coemansia sp. RSA 552]
MVESITDQEGELVPWGGETFERSLGVLQNEWRRMEQERAQWAVERIRLKAQVSAQERRIAQLSALYGATQRQMEVLEAALRQVRQPRGGEPEPSDSESEASQVSEVVAVTRETRGRSRALLARCVDEIEALLGNESASNGRRLSGIIESEPPALAADAGSSLSLVSSQVMPVDDKRGRRISEPRRTRRRASQPPGPKVGEGQEQGRPRSAALRVDEVDGVDGEAPGAWAARRAFVGHLDGVRAVAAWTDAGVRRALSGSEDGTVMLWDVDHVRARGRRSGEGGPRAVLRGHLAAATSCAAASGHPYVYSAGLDGSIRQWDVVGKSGSVFARGQLAGHTDAVWGLALAPSSGILASVGADATCRVWRVGEVPETKACVTLAQAQAGAGVATAVSLGGSRLVLGYDSGQVEVRDVERTTESALLGSGSTFGGRVTSVAQDEQHLVAAAMAGGGVRVFDVRTGKAEMGAALAVVPRAGVAATAVAMSPAAGSASWVAVGSSDGTVRWWDRRRTAIAVSEVSAHGCKADEGVHGLAVLSDTAVVSAGADGLLKLLELV